MTPTTVHRYAWPVREAIEALLGDAAGDAESWRIRVEDDQVVVDIVAPAEQAQPTAPATQEAEASKEPAPQEQDPKPERKGGELAKKAGIICTEKAFWAWAEVRTEDEAKKFIYEECGVTSRADLDHDPEAGRKFRDIYTSYQNWLNDE